MCWFRLLTKLNATLTDSICHKLTASKHVCGQTSSVLIRNKDDSTKTATRPVLALCRLLRFRAFLSLFQQARPRSLATGTGGCCGRLAGDAAARDPGRFCDPLLGLGSPRHANPAAGRPPHHRSRLDATDARLVDCRTLADAVPRDIHPFVYHRIWRAPQSPLCGVPHLSERGIRHAMGGPQG